MKRSRTVRSRWWLAVVLGATTIAGILALLPVLASVLTGDARGVTTTAAGSSAVVGLRAGDTYDEVLLVPLEDPRDPAVVARVERLPETISRGAVSPDGRQLALIVPVAGTPSSPEAALVVVELGTGASRTLAGGLPYLQTPLWGPESSFVVVRRAAAGGEVLVRVGLDGSERELFARSGVLGLYPVGYAPDGSLYAVALDRDGSLLLRDGTEVVRFSDQLTRDWALSPDGTQLAYVVQDLREGLRFVGQVLSLDGRVTAQALTDDRERLRPAWRPDGSGVQFGEEPVPDGGVVAAGASGFDLPVAFDPRSGAVLLERWDGPSFQQPGHRRYVVETAGSSVEIEGVTRVFGWAAP